MDEELPEGVFEENGSLYRIVLKTAPDGETWEQKKPVARSLEEAQARRMDFYHPQLGWIVGGYKLEKDRETQSIISDGSQGTPLPIEQQEAQRAEALKITHS